MIFVVFFGRFALQGLASDAAMYAGLARSILEHGHAWAPRGISMFPVFFEHPPYTFQWGAWVLAVLGQSDGAARAIGAIPGALALGALIIWLWRRHSWPLAFWTLFLLLTFGHYTKYAATIMLEAPLSLGAILFAIGTFEYFFRRAAEARWLGLAVLGVMIATAAKGVVGGLFCAGLTPFVLFASPRDQDWLRRLTLWFVFAGLGFLVPLLAWAMMTAGEGGEASLLHRYLSEQVFRSYATDRGHPELYTQSWSWWTYPYVVLKYGWPWWWTVPMGTWWVFRRDPLQESFLKSWSKLALAFFAVLLVAFSTSHVRLPHYLHPTYLILAPLGGYFMMTVADRFVRIAPRSGKLLRWTLAGVLAVGMLLAFRGSTRTKNRGLEFARLGVQLRTAAELCKVWVPEDEADTYQLESYFLWYVNGREYRRVPRADFESSRAAFSEARIWWSPRSEALLIHPQCARNVKGANNLRHK